MPGPKREDQCPTPWPAGFTIFELMMVLLIVLTVVAALTPGVSRSLTHARVNRAANMVASQFYLAQSMAGRQHRPIRLTVNKDSLTISLADAVSGTTFTTQRFGLTSAFKLDSLAASPSTPVYLYPSGLSSSADTVRVVSGSYRQKVYLSKAGQIRILR
jgi:type II secretory pathway pseudopilin PulG